MKPLWIGLFVAVPLAACQDTAAPVIATRLTFVRATISPNILRGGDTATIVVSFVNQSPMPIRVAGGVCPFSFAVLDVGGHVVSGSPAQPCSSLLIRLTIQPHDSTTQAFRWIATSGGMALTPGAYNLIGACDWTPEVRSTPEGFAVTP